MAMQQLTKESFDEVITQHPMVLVDFWAPWCGPCRVFSEIYEMESKKFPDVVFGKVNIEEEPELAKDFNIRSIPFLMIFRGNLAVYAEAGALTAPALSDIIQQAKSLDLKEIMKSLANQNEKGETN
jgi:thioredoxin 1